MARSGWGPPLLASMASITLSATWTGVELPER